MLDMLRKRLFRQPLFLFWKYLSVIDINEMKRVKLTENELKSIVSECVERLLEGSDSALTEDMTRGQVEDQIEDYVKGRDFEKRVNNIVVDVLGDFIENMWTKKSFWKTMLKRK